MGINLDEEDEDEYTEEPGALPSTRQIEVIQETPELDSKKDTTDPTPSPTKTARSKQGGAKKSTTSSKSLKFKSL